MIAAHLYRWFLDRQAATLAELQDALAQERRERAAERKYLLTQAARAQAWALRWKALARLRKRKAETQVRVWRCKTCGVSWYKAGRSGENCGPPATCTAEVAPGVECGAKEFDRKNYLRERGHA